MGDLPLIPETVEDFGGDEDDPMADFRIQYGQQIFSAAHASLDMTNLNIPSNFRVWESISKSNCIGQGFPFQFKVISYNLLAQYMLECHSNLYSSCMAHDLKWHARATRLYTEITSYAPDIMCFQEVQESHLSTFYSRFGDIGYCGIFKKRTGLRQDGCAIYFRRALFELVDHTSVEFNQPELSILERDNIGIIAKLMPKNLVDTAVVVATTHLHYGSPNEDVRLAQMQLFLAEIDRVAYYNTGREAGHLPIILTGDFNSTPDSDVIKLLDRGHVNGTRDNSNWMRIGVTDNCQHLTVYLNQIQGRFTEFADIKKYLYRFTIRSCLQLGSTVFQSMFIGNAIGHSLRLTSVYDKFKSSGNEATAHHGQWITADYIYFSCCSPLKLVDRLRLPTSSECQVLGCLPNEQFASDHLVLGAIFELQPRQST